MTAPPLVVEVERSGLVESTHLVDVAIVAAGGAIVAAAGDRETITYLRSTAKPVQASVCLDAGWPATADDAVAIACASHNGEPAHLDAVRRVLSAAGLSEDDLLCPPALPRDPTAASEPARIFHNCSGKHAAMLATAALNGWSRRDYRVEDLPLQRAVADRLSALAGRVPRAVGIDGCGVPTFAYALEDAARIFSSLPADAPRAVAAMRAHPFLVAGTGRLCTAVLGSVPGVVIKVGAEGMFCGVLIDQGVGFALKARDGAVRAAEAAAVMTLQFLRVVPDEVPANLAPAPVLGGGAPVGTLRIRGELSHS